MWETYTPRSKRDLALRLVEDSLGYTWLAMGDRLLHLAEVHTPGDMEAMGAYRAAVRAREPATASYDECLPRAFWDPQARIDVLDRYGIDEAVVFPQYGLMWERRLADDLEATLLNMEASNRWACDVRSASGGRLHPVGRVTLRDLDWLEAQLATLARCDVRLAMIAPSLVDGRPFSHPSLDRAWLAFERHDITPCFHVAASPRPFQEGWYGVNEDVANPDPITPMMSSIFLYVAPAVSLADMAVEGVFQRHPNLRLGVMELTAHWIPAFLAQLDTAIEFFARFNGRPDVLEGRRPSDQVREHVRIAAFAGENPVDLVRRAGDLFMYTSDYPHAEGLAVPLDGYRAVCDGLTSAEEEALFGGNIRWLLRAEEARR
jgi:predicted TIM-barrel fold metal-dependent hydrolase